MIGQTISHYRVLDKLGEGGMGVVYKAEDVKLGRTVALKFLPSEGLNDEERKGRFLHEAQAAAALDHPNICTVYEIDEVDGRLFMAMPFLAGRTLDRRIEEGPLPIDQAVEIALQLADALGEAHAKGIVHRDVKPSNVMLLEREDKPVQVKLMDFGLARLSEATRLTREGVQPGTVQYMSPEQISGEKIDHRTDIWSLGVVLYEMIAGRPPFEGAYEQALYYGILNEQPEPLTGLRTGVPLDLERVVLKCLGKRPVRRYQSSSELRVDLSSISDPVGGAQEKRSRYAPPVAEESPGRSLWKMAVALVLVALAAFWAGSAIRGFEPVGGTASRSDESPGNVTRFSIDLSPEQHIALDTDTRMFDISADGSVLAWVSDGQPRRIFHRRLNEREVREVPGIQGVENIGFAVSPDGREVAFVRDQSLWRAPIDGGAATRLMRYSGAAGLFSFDWGEDGSIVAGVNFSGLVRFEPPEMAPEIIFELDASRDEVAVANPRVLPGGRKILMTVGIRHWAHSRLEILDLDAPAGQRRKVLAEDVFFADYLAPGHLLITRGAEISTIPFDSDRGEILGAETRILPGVETDLFGRMAQLTVSRGGTLATIPRQGANDWGLALVDRRGEAQILRLPPGNYGHPRFSPDGLRALFTLRKSGERNPHVYILELSRSTMQQLTRSGDEGGVWSPDGESVAFASVRDGPAAVYLTTPSGDAAARRVATSGFFLVPDSWFPDGRRLLVHERLPHDVSRMGVIDVDRAGEAITWITPDGIGEKLGDVSPDGAWIAFQSDEEGRPEIFVREIEAESGVAKRKLKVSGNGGWHPVWSSNGGEIFYLSAEADKVLVTPIQKRPTFELGAERVAADLSGIEVLRPHWNNLRLFGVAPDGERFLVVARQREERSMRLDVTLNWPSELEQQESR